MGFRDAQTPIPRVKLTLIELLICLEVFAILAAVI